MGSINCIHYYDINMKRFLALDIGHKYIGIAVSDPMGWTAQGLTTITRDENKTELEIIGDYLEEYDVEAVVIGMPINMNGTYGPMAQMVEEFGTELSDKYSIEVIYQDERLSSVAAEQVLIQGSIRRENRKNYIDKVAATLILQTYLDRN